jgi:hypothetical protein
MVGGARRPGIREASLLFVGQQRLSKSDSKGVVGRAQRDATEEIGLSFIEQQTLSTPVDHHT